MLVLGSKFLQIQPPYKVGKIYMRLKAFTLIELLVVATIIILMAVIAVPKMERNQALVELQNKSDEIVAGISGMQIKALNTEQGVVRYYAQVTPTSGGVAGKVDYGSWDGVSTGTTVYKTISVTSDQKLSKISAGNTLVCDRAQSYCCNVTGATLSCSTAMNNADFFKLEDTDLSKTYTYKIFGSPFRITVTGS